MGNCGSLVVLGDQRFRVVLLLRCRLKCSMEFPLLYTLQYDYYVGQIAL